jgi:acetyl esterase/lipase
LKKNLIYLISVLFLFSNGLAQVKYKLIENIQYYHNIKNDSCALDIYYPANKKNFPTIVWFHGGGLKNGDKKISDRLKRQELAVVSANYRLYPNVTTEQVISDAAAAVAWTFNNIKNYGGNKDLIFVSGHSAGGYLTSMIGLDKKWLNKYDIDANKIAGLIPFSGHTITHFTVREEMGILDRNKVVVDEMAPLYHVRKDAPPYIIMTGDRNLELLGRYEENAYMMRMMKSVGHKQTMIYEFDGYGHGMAEPGNPILIKFVKSHTEKIIKKKNY